MRSSSLRPASLTIAAGALVLLLVVACGPAAPPPAEPAAPVLIASTTAPVSTSTRPVQASPRAIRPDPPIAYEPCTKAPTPEEIATAKSLFVAGAKAFANGDYAQSIDSWREAFEHDCTAVVLLLNLANAYEKEERFSAALISLDTFVQRSPQNAPSMTSRIRQLQRIQAVRSLPNLVPPQASSSSPSAPP